MGGLPLPPIPLGPLLPAWGPRFTHPAAIPPWPLPTGTSPRSPVMGTSPRSPVWGPPPGPRHGGRPSGPPGPPSLKPSSPVTKSEPPCPISVLAAGGFRVCALAACPGVRSRLRFPVAQSALGPIRRPKAGLRAAVASGLQARGFAAPRAPTRLISWLAVLQRLRSPSNGAPPGSWGSGTGISTGVGTFQLRQRPQSRHRGRHGRAAGPGGRRVVGGRLGAGAAEVGRLTWGNGGDGVARVRSRDRFFALASVPSWWLGQDRIQF